MCVAHRPKRPMVNHWHQNATGRRRLQRLSPLSTTLNISCNAIIHATPSSIHRVAIPFRLCLSPLSYSHLLLCLVVFLAVTPRYPYTWASSDLPDDEPKQLKEIQREIYLQELLAKQLEDTMSPALPDREPVPSDDSTADSLTAEPAGRASRVVPRTVVDAHRKP